MYTVSLSLTEVMVGSLDSFVSSLSLLLSLLEHDVAASNEKDITEMQQPIAMERSLFSDLFIFI